MGGGSSARSRPSSSPEGGEPAHIAVSKLWMATWKTVDKSSDPMRSHVIQKPGWKTVRLYVSSTFEDFGLEREILATKVSTCWKESKVMNMCHIDEHPLNPKQKILYEPNQAYIVVKHKL